jgi:hypothetical protein
MIIISITLKCIIIFLCFLDDPDAVTMDFPFVFSQWSYVASVQTNGLEKSMLCKELPHLSPAQFCRVETTIVWGYPKVGPTESSPIELNLV